ncbi:hypothetical protein [Pseudoalteromonas rubra]|uniref:Uncharacterized protein n=1 Tax=Pseudoalteromonas rubra TaxID=43658 RepID=A0A5S3X6J9_9GAMM|nr:hypothetical protein [Pseudoalteromonas rubra]TMP39565.1 hypothetical protein CWB98_02965 [Pseudoalteromonas rubra]
MKLALKKSNIKNLSNNAQLQMDATPAVAGGAVPTIDNTPTKYLRTCPQFTIDWQYSCGVGATCNREPV